LCVEGGRCGILGNLKRFLVGFLIVGAFASVLFSERGFVFAGPPLSGDWIVTGTESYYDTIVVLNGNLIIEDGGNLTFRKVTLKMNCTYDGQYYIQVRSGGKFYVLEGSVITSVDSEKEYSFGVENGSTLRMMDSELHECGFGFEGGASGLLIESNDVVIENNWISNNWYGIVCASSNPVIRNNNISSNRVQAVILGNSNATIEANYMRNNGGGGIYARFSSPIIQDNLITLNNGAGIHILDRSIPTIQGNNITANNYGIIAEGEGTNPTIHDNYISRNNGAGISVGGCGATIYNNTITSNKAEGIWCCNSSPTIHDNNITSNSFCGIYSFNQSKPTIQGNIISSNWEAIVVENSNAGIQNNRITNNRIGIWIYQFSSPVIQGNNIISNIEIGIWCTNHSSPLIQGNILTFNGGYGIGCREESQPEIHKNDIYGNVNYGLCNEDESVIINATYNYWGDGPTTFGNVLYEPWLTESIVPFAEITSPLLGEIVSSTVAVSTEVRAQNGVDKVEFYVDDQLKYTDYDASYEWNWDTTQYTETEHKITANAHDEFGLNISTSITVFVDNTPPTVSIKEPTPENMYYGIVSVSVNATDNKEMGNVHVKVDNTDWLVMTYDPAVLVWKYDLNTTPLSDGQHTLMVLALDKASNPATMSTTLLTDNSPPTLTIQAPQSGITVGLTLLVKVQASDLAGVSRIEFYLQDVLVCTIYETPYQWSWDTTKYPNGDYTITIKAYDTIGNVKTSETTVTVQNVELPWWQTHALTIIQVLIAIGGLILGTLTYLTRKREKKKKKK